MTSGNEPRGKSHALNAEMARNQARRYGHSRVVDDAEGDGEEEQRLVARSDIHENQERQASEKVDARKQCRPVHAIGKPTRQDHAAEIHRGQHAVRGRARQRRKSAECRIGDEVRLDDARRRVSAEKEAPEQGMEDRPPQQFPNFCSDVTWLRLRICRLIDL